MKIATGDIYECLEDIANLSNLISIHENEDGRYFWKYKELTSITEDEEVYDTPESCITGLALWLSSRLEAVETTFAAYREYQTKKQRSAITKLRSQQMTND